MKIKLDENLGKAVVEPLQKAGHEVETVRQENLSGTNDWNVINICKLEKRCLITLDLDFSNPLVFNPIEYYGIAVFRLPPHPSYQDFFTYSQTFTLGLVNYDIVGKLWIVQRDKIRIYEPK